MNLIARLVEIKYDPNQPRDEGGRWSSGSGGGSLPSSGSGDDWAENAGQAMSRFQADVSRAYKSEQHTPPPPGESYQPDVEADHNNDGVTDAARVGVPAMHVPPPPPIPRLPNLTPQERQVESEFADAFEADPDGVASKFRELALANTKPGEPPTFGTDDAKVLHSKWSSPDLTLEQRSQNRATYNTALHQTANAIAKRAFVQHLDTLQPGDEVMVTVGGCGAGKGYCLGKDKDTGQPFVPEAYEAKMAAKAVWDSAGDQNATENPWIQQELEARGLKGSYVYVHANPETQWGHPERGVIKRAGDPKDGRMVDAKVFADSYAIGAKNHDAFYEGNKDNPNARFVFIETGSPPRRIERVPSEALSLNRHSLKETAVRVVHERTEVQPHIKRGALIGERVWPGEA